MRMGFPGMEPPELPPGVKEAIERVHQAEFEHQVAWRKITTGPWAMLFCACRLPDPELPRQSLLQFRPHEPLSAGCPVHGSFLMLHTGEVI